MRCFIKLSLLVLMVISSGTLQSAPKHTAQRGCTFITEDGGYISLRVIEYGAKTEVAVANAKKLAIETILFRGVEKSKLAAKAMAGTNEGALKDAHKDYFKEFFDKRRFETFVASSFIVTPLAKDITNQKFIIVDIKINVKALKSDMETNKIIRKFGF